MVNGDSAFWQGPGAPASAVNSDPAISGPPAVHQGYPVSPLPAQDGPDVFHKDLEQATPTPVDQRERRAGCCGMSRRACTITAAVIIVLLLAGIGAGVGVGVSKSKSSPSPSPSPPPPPPPAPSTPPPTKPTTAPTANLGSCFTDVECNDVTLLCVAGACSTVAPDMYTCTSNDQCSSEGCDSAGLFGYTNVTQKLCLISNGNLCSVDAQCASGACVEAGSGMQAAQYCMQASGTNDSPPPTFLNGRSCHYDIDCGGGNGRCIESKCTTKFPYNHVCSADDSCFSDSCNCFGDTGCQKTCLLPEGSACSSTLDCAGVLICDDDYYCGEPSLGPTLGPAPLPA